MDRTTLSFSSEKGISCMDCGQWFSSVLSFMVHINAHHRGATAHQCQICAGVSFSLDEFQKHLLLHSQATPTSSIGHTDSGGGHLVQTSNVGQSLDVRKRKLTTDETQRLHTEAQPAKKLCPDECPTADNDPLGAVGSSPLHPAEDPLDVTSYSGNPSVAQCEDPLRVDDVCTTTFPVEDQGNEPVLTEKECPFCSEVFGSEYHLAMHRPFCSYLNNPGPVWCNVCRRQFLNSAFLKRHRCQTGHGVHQKKAPSAGGADDRGVQPGTHVQVEYMKTLASTVTPQAERSIQRPLYDFQSPDDLSRSCSSNDPVDATNEPSEMSLVAPLDSPSPQNFVQRSATQDGRGRVRRICVPKLQCPWCPRYFSDGWKLSRHMRTRAHSWTRDDFPCYMCGMTYVSASALSRHASKLGHRMVNSAQVVLASAESLPAGAIQVKQVSSDAPIPADATWTETPRAPFGFGSDRASGLNEALSNSAGMSGEEASLSQADVDPLSVIDMQAVSSVTEDFQLHADLDADETPHAPATIEDGRNYSDCGSINNIFKKSDSSWVSPDLSEEHGASQKPYVDDALPLFPVLEDGGEDSDSSNVVILSSKPDGISESTDPSKEHRAPQEFDEDTLLASAEAEGEDWESDSVMSLSNESDSASESPNPIEEYVAPVKISADETLPLSAALEDEEEDSDSDGSKKSESASKNPDLSSLSPSAVSGGGGDKYDSDYKESSSKNPDHLKETQSRRDRVNEGSTAAKLIDSRKCPLCPKRLARSGDVVRHLKSRLHAGRSSYNCDGCSAKFRTVNSLMRHRTSEHRMSTVSASKSPVPRKEFNVQQFVTSDRVESRGLQLKRPKIKQRREASQSGGNRFNCAACGLTFPSLHRLRRHLRTRKHETYSMLKTCLTSVGSLQSSWGLQADQSITGRLADSSDDQQNAGEHPQPQEAAGLSTLQQSKQKPAADEQQNKPLGESSLIKNEGNPKRVTSSTPAQLERRNYRFSGHTLKRERPKFKCPACRKLFCSSNMAAHLRSAHRGQKLYKCSACPEDFWSHTARKQHIILKHCQARPVNGIYFSKSDKLSSGRIKHEHRSSTVQCPLCSRRIANVRMLTGHLISMHPDEKAFTCSSCDERFSTVPDLKCHLVSEHGQPVTYTCMVCGEEMATTRDHTELHRRDRETAEASAASEIANLPPASVSGVSQPSPGQQNTIARKRCWKSPEASPTSINDSADARLRVDSRKCPLCPKRFSRPANVLRHLHSRLHAGQRWYRCDVCSSKFRTANSLMRHRMSAHQMNIDGGLKSSDPHEEPDVEQLSRTDPEKLQNSASKNPRTFKPARTCERLPKTFNCLKCDKKLPSFRHFQKHLASSQHRNGGPKRVMSSTPFGRFQKRKIMEVSGPSNQKRVRAFNLSEHLRSGAHHAGKAFKCASCLANFWTSTALNQHIMLKHCESPSTNSFLGYRYFRALPSSDKPSLAGGKELNARLFRCPLCCMRTGGASKLDRHLVRVHRGEKVFTCPSCSERFPKLCHLKFHLMSKHGQPMTYTCSLCGEEMACSGDHTHLHKRDARTIESLVVENSSIFAVTASGASQSPHSKQDTTTRKRSWKTPEVPPTGLNTEYTDANQNLNARKCPLCAKLLARPMDVLRHLKTRLHAGQTWYRCDMCSSGFRTANSLMRHRTSTHLTSIDGASKSEDPTEEQDAQLLLKSEHEEFHRPVIELRQTVNARPNTWTCAVCGEKIATKDAHSRLHNSSSEILETPPVFSGDMHTPSFSISDVSHASPDKQKLQGPHHDTEMQGFAEARGISPATTISDHRDANQTVDPRKCPLCPKLLSRPDDVLRHLKSRLHAGQNWYNCDVCSCRFRTVTSLMRHRTSEHLANIDNTASGPVAREEHGVQQCSNSDHSASEKSELSGPSDAEPARASDTVQKKFKCWKCNIRFLTLSDFQRHLTSRRHNHGRTPPEASTREVSSQDVREVEIHGRVPSTDATAVDIQHKAQDNLQNQNVRDNQSTKQQETACAQETIPKVFSYKRGCNRFKCPKCDKTFRDRYEVRRHLTSAVTHRRPAQKKSHWSKDAPTMNFVSRAVPRYHLPSQFSSTLAQYKCPKCDKKFYKIYDLLRHLASKLHGAGNFLLICSVCRKGFSGVKTLKEHQRIHGTMVSTPFLLEVQEDEEIRHPLLVGDQPLQKPEQLGDGEPAGDQAPAQSPSPAGDSQTVDSDAASVSITKASPGKDGQVDQRYAGEPIRVRCKFCSVSLYPSSLHRHLRRAHPDQRGYSCFECKKSFFTPAGLAQHGSQENHVTQLFRCRVCGELMTSRFDHAGMHKPNQPLMGSLSSTRGSSKSEPDKSSADTETMYMPSKCARCGEGFKTVVQRKQHSCQFKFNGHDDALALWPEMKMCQIRIRRCDEVEPKQELSDYFGQDPSQRIKMESSMMDGKYSDMINPDQDIGSTLHGIVKVEEMTMDLEITSQIRIKEEPVEDHAFNNEGQNLDGDWLTGYRSELSQDTDPLSGIGLKLEPQEGVKENESDVKEAEQKYHPPDLSQV